MLKNKFDCNLVITGKKDPLYAPEITNQDDNIMLTGLVSEDDLIALYNGAKAYVFPSLYEGFGLSPLEAMQCGVPVVASNSSCIPEVCGEENAVYFDPNNPVEMAEKIYKVLSNQDLRQKLINNCREYVKIFSWQKMAQETYRLYDEIQNQY